MIYGGDMSQTNTMIQGGDLGDRVLALPPEEFKTDVSHMDSEMCLPDGVLPPTPHPRQKKKKNKKQQQLWTPRLG